MSVENMNKTNSAKYGLSPDEIEKCSLSSKIIRNTLDKYDAKIYSHKKRNLEKT